MTYIIPTDHIELSLEQSLDHCIKCNICTSACPVSAVTDKFPGPKYVGPQAQRFRQPRQPTPDESVDYCSGCRVCNQVCPTGVRIAELNGRARAKIVQQKGLSLRNRILGHADILGMLGSGPLAPLANTMLSLAPVRYLTEQVMGIARHAPLPAFSTYTFRSWFKRRARKQGRPSILSNRKVVYFHGCATNYYEPWVGKAAVEVLEHNGFEVILAEQNCCGLPLLSNGAFPQAHNYHQGNLRKLVPYVKQGIPVVGTSTSCTLTLKEEAPELLGLHDADVNLLAEHTYDIFEFLRIEHAHGRLRTDFKPLDRTLPYHAPCQLRAHRIGRPALDVLELVPGLHLMESQSDCCGIAGTYGVKTEKYQIGMDVGAGLFDFVRRSESDLALCDSETCRWQITHGAGVASKHPIEILREAYG
ncbi:MAG: anaerobic glycerol-3-phosphate dehydrogenase subunit C [Chloroflexaceae bacterium]|nr:anaerobic glycerol-3-phosphate dehydrogenase subunit C [Chloroflexaceae bacterium]NJL34684.1 anaerobic glycerol-3-phosphate dehydrogenase subunit C [Chloroflexaceae bacterium]